MIIHTEAGEISVLTPDQGRVDALRTLLPMGAYPLDRPDIQARWGIVMQCGDREVYAIKQQSIDLPEDLAMTEFSNLSMLKVAAMHKYLQHGFGGVLMPLVYWRRKGDLHEVGLAYFGAPSPSGVEASTPPEDSVWDQRFGHGYSRMVLSFIRALVAAQQMTGLTMQTIIGLDYRPRLSLGTLFFGHALHAKDVYVLRQSIPEGDDDPAWWAFRSTGIDRVYHLPSVPFVISESDLADTRPRK